MSRKKHPKPYTAYCLICYFEYHVEEEGHRTEQCPLSKEESKEYASPSVIKQSLFQGCSNVTHMLAYHRKSNSGKIDINEFINCESWLMLAVRRFPCNLRLVEEILAWKPKLDAVSKTGHNEKDEIVFEGYTTIGMAIQNFTGNSNHLLHDATGKDGAESLLVLLRTLGIAGAKPNENDLRVMEDLAHWDDFCGICAIYLGVSLDPKKSVFFGKTLVVRNP